MTRQRSLGLTSATALVVANMIGAGVFTTSGFLLADLGSPLYVLLAWAAGGVQAALGAVCYGALARRIPESGGEYRFLSRALHPAAGYVAGWLSLLVGFSAPLAAAAFAFGTYARPWLGGLSPAAAGSILIAAFAAVHAGEVRRGAQVQNGAVLLKVALIAAFAAFSLAAGEAPPAEPLPPFPLAAFGVSLVWISFSYSGWNAAVYVAGEIRDPERTVPRSLILGTALVTVLYLALNAAFVLAAPAAELAGRLEVGRIAARALGGAVLEEAVAGLIALVLVSSVSSLVMAGPRVYAQMAADGYLPRRLAVVSGPPRAAIAVQAGLALFFLWSATFEAMLTWIGFTLSLSTAAAVTALIVLKSREGAKMEVPGWPLVPWLFLAGVAAMTVFTAAQRPLESLVGLATIAAGLAAWRIQSRK
ncbi:MAG: amino acid permease [Syntrophales bacterium]|nr:amino acid permease [Syntrophales bacterium]MCU0582705.1 amino acid permease [Syntrophales bacterium]